MIVLWLPSAQKDIASVVDFYHKKIGKKGAQERARTIVDSAQQLTHFPSLGKPMLEGDVLEWFLPSLPYTLPYRVRGETIEILRVWHQSQDKPSAWE